ncbi:MAG: hypothetical protein IJD60_12530 [Clostridia bacterium]|nr:hypothetical protein [Clostridia bacterium]
MSCCHHHHACGQHCGCGDSYGSYCPYPEWKHPLLCNPAHLCSAENDNGPTLVIHAILLEPCGSQSCTPRTFTIRVTGPSYPCGETFTLRAGSCTEIDEPLVITGLIPGQYQVEQVVSGCSCGCGSQYDTTFTGPISCGYVAITASRVPTVITIVNRKRLRGCRCHRNGCGGSYNGCGSTYNSSYGYSCGGSYSYAHGC